jgi:hypothetical protein
VRQIQIANFFDAAPDVIQQEPVKLIGERVIIES